MSHGQGDWKYYSVTLTLMWMGGAQNFSATLVSNIHATSPGHAVARVTDGVHGFGVEIMDAYAVEVR